jgi:hypothetical protein
MEPTHRDSDAFTITRYSSGARYELSCAPHPRSHWTAVLDRSRIAHGLHHPYLSTFGRPPT